MTCAFQKCPPPPPRHPHQVPGCPPLGPCQGDERPHLSTQCSGLAPGHISSECVQRALWNQALDIESSLGPEHPPLVVLRARPYFLWHLAQLCGLARILGLAISALGDGQLLEVRGLAVAVVAGVARGCWAHSRCLNVLARGLNRELKGCRAWLGCPLGRAGAGQPLMERKKQFTP